MNIDDLREFMGSRQDGYWELLASAVGISASLRKTKEGLTEKSFAATKPGFESSPSLVELRIQALGAYDWMEIEALAREWAPMYGLRRDLLDHETDIRTVAWAASLRFLKVVPGVDDRKMTELPLFLSSELRANRPHKTVQSFAELCGLAKDPEATYDDYRVLSLSTNEGFCIDESDILDLLGTEWPDEKGLERLRVLLRAPVVYSESAQAFLRATFSRIWRSEFKPGPNHGALAVLLEILLSLGFEDHFFHEIRELLVARMKNSNFPQNLACFAYLLARTNWRCP